MPACQRFGPESDLKEAIWRAYRYLYLLGKDNKLTARRR